MVEEVEENHSNQEMINNSNPEQFQEEAVEEVEVKEIMDLLIMEEIMVVINLMVFLSYHLRI